MPKPDVQADHTSVLRHLIDTLFDFESLPGRYPLSLREPRILFDGSHDVLLLAAGRPVKGLAFDLTDMSRLKRAASFFVRTAMLRPGSDHYTVLGLKHGFSENSLRLHYRILVRLTHPDFVGKSNGEFWPTGSATRVNLPHDVLSSAIRHSEYNRTLPGREKRRILPRYSHAAVLPRPVAYGSTLFKYRTLAFVSAGFFALLLLGTLWHANSDDTHQTRVAQIEPPDSPGAAAAQSLNSARSAVQRQAGSAPTVSASSSGSADKASKDLRAKVVSASSEAKEAEIANLGQAEKLSQLVQQENVAKLTRSVKAVQDASMVETEQAATLKELRLASEATLAQAKLEALASQTLPDPHAAALLLQASKTDQASLEFKVVRSTQRARSIQETQLALTARLPNNAEVSAIEVASMTGNAAPVKLLPIQPVSDAAAKPNLVDAQPTLNQLIQSMQAGRGEDLLRGLERFVSRSSGAADLVNAYNLLIGGLQAVRVGRVQLLSRPSGDQLTVDGVVQLILQDQGQPLPIRELQLRAAFVMRDGQAVMTELSTSGSRP